MPARQARRAFAHEATRGARGRPDSRRAESSPLWRGHRQSGMSSWTTQNCTRQVRRQQRLVGLKPLWNRVSGPTGAIIMCLRQLGWDMATSHDLRHCEWARGGLARNMEHGRQGAGQRGRQRSGTVEGVGRQRRTERVAAAPAAGTSDIGKTSAPSDTVSSAPAIRAALGVIHAGCWTQEVANKAATTGWFEAIVEQSQWPDRSHHHVSEAAGMVMALTTRFSSLRTGTSWTCDRFVPGTLSRKRWWTVNWRCGRTGPATVMSGKSSSRALCWNLRCGRTNELSVGRKRRQRPRRPWGDTFRLVDAGIGHKAGMSECPFCLNCGPGVRGSRSIDCGHVQPTERPACIRSPRFV